MTVYIEREYIDEFGDFISFERIVCDFCGAKYPEDGTMEEAAGFESEIYEGWTCIRGENPGGCICPPCQVERVIRKVAG